MPNDKDTLNNRAINEAFVLTPYCERHFDRTLKLEKDMAVLAERFLDLSDIKDSIKSIEKYIAASASNFPKIESQITTLSKSVSNSREEIEKRIENHEQSDLPRIEKGILDLSNKFDHQKEILDEKINKIENSIISNDARSKVIFAILAALGTGVAAIVGKIILSAII